MELQRVHNEQGSLKNTVKEHPLSESKAFYKAKTTASKTVRYLKQETNTLKSHGMETTNSQCMET